MKEKKQWTAVPFSGEIKFQGLVSWDILDAITEMLDNEWETDDIQEGSSTVVTLKDKHSESVFNSLTELQDNYKNLFCNVHEQMPMSRCDITILFFEDGSADVEKYTIVYDGNQWNDLISPLEDEEI